MAVFAIQLLLLLSLALLVAAPVALVVRWRKPAGRVTLWFVAGAAAGGILLWNAVPATWTLPFWTTLQASVNAQRYGHTVEHAAQNLVVMITFGCVLCGALSGALSATLFRGR